MHIATTEGYRERVYEVTIGEKAHDNQEHASKGPDPEALLSWKELQTLPPPTWLLDGFVPEGVTTLYGPPNEGKTFTALHMALTIAVRGELAVYIAGEGVSGLPKRIKAWLDHHGYTDEDIDRTFLSRRVPVDMLDFKAVEKFVIRSLATESLKAIFIDTLARSFAGGQ